MVQKSWFKIDALKRASHFCTFLVDWGNPTYCTDCDCSHYIPEYYSRNPPRSPALFCNYLFFILFPVHLLKLLKSWYPSMG